MNPKISLIASLIGTTVVALCCFTPILVVILGILGLGAWVGYLDIVLLPALGVMVGLTLYSYWRYRRSHRCEK
ncbi:mercury resistance system transport protein MerF [Leptolyngbya iicbica]|mgnify:CR=1 FL=1|jgi:mercuric ion transport protein|uniref:Mercury resistance system transport protein MerF n=2 Tax=Cyanophyceae TaxID=3028117 RepID=A0A4Q7E942_9CYAN|nr:mercury resistance system transport protein MerF [Leptolyngbya sp. LK]RZM79088.1 mercury resistance system transport protein MerF [Leptolyngbya sp. LK]